MTGQDIAAGIRKNKLSVICGALSVALIVVWYLRSDLIAEAETQLTEKTAEAQKYATNIQYSAQLKEQVDRVAAANKQIESRAVRPSQLGVNSQYFYNIEKSTGAKMIDLRQLTLSNVAKPAKGSFLPVQFAVGVQGDLKHILVFLRQIESGEHYSRISSATFTGNPQQRNGSLTLSLNLELLGAP